MCSDSSCESVCELISDMWNGISQTAIFKCHLTTSTRLLIWFHSPQGNKYSVTIVPSSPPTATANRIRGIRFMIWVLPYYNLKPSSFVCFSFEVIFAVVETYTINQSCIRSISHSSNQIVLYWNGRFGAPHIGTVSKVFPCLRQDLLILSFSLNLHLHNEMCPWLTKILAAASAELTTACVICSDSEREKSICRLQHKRKWSGLLHSEPRRVLSLCLGSCQCRDAGSGTRTCHWNNSAAETNQQHQSVYWPAQFDQAPSPTSTVPWIIAMSEWVSDWQIGW